MRNLAPDIMRQRLLIEGYYTIDVGEQQISRYMSGIAKKLELRTYGDATIHSTGGAGRPENEGYDAFIPLIDSGISLYVWSSSKFFASILFTCKEFSNDNAVRYAQDFFGSTEIEYSTF